MTPIRLVAAPRPAPLPARDAAQATVIARRQGDGPLVVLGAPGTGKTTTLIELVATRIERDGVRPDTVLVLAASRVAAAALRDQLSDRVGRTVTEPMARTPHSYAFGVLRRARVLEGDAPPRLISGPEQDRVLVDLLAGHLEGIGRVPNWPQELRPEIRLLRGFRGELRDLMMRALERGLAPEDLAELSRRADRPEWSAAAELLAEYLDVTSLATPGAYDPAGIVDAAAWLLDDDAELREQEWQRCRLVVVDDAQELSAASARLLDVLCRGGRDLVLFGDPDAATQGFRGASPRLIAEASDRFPTPDGTRSPVHVLAQVWRHSELLRSVARRVVDRIGSAGTVVHRAAAVAPSITDVAGPQSDGDVEVRVLASPSHQAAAVAYALRRWHLIDGLGWDRMAVIVRSTRAAAGLRRALQAAGVPVIVSAADVPVRDEPAVRPLRLALRCVLDPAELTAEVAVELVSGPFGGADAVALRRLRQALRAEELAAGGARSSDDLLVEGLGDPVRLASLEPGVSAAARRVARVLAAGRTAAWDVGGEPSPAPQGTTAETVLWAMWNAAGLADPWRRAALAGGITGARADRDLDAVVALFEAAARYVDRLPQAGPAGFLQYLDGQDLPSDTLAERAPAGASVALLSPAAAAGQEWDGVVVAGVQEGSWPDLRLRDSLLGGEVLVDLLDGRGDGEAGSPVARRRALLDDELRLFHVAVSRARQRLLVTAVRSEEELPSPFLDLVVPPDGEDADESEPAAVPRALSLPALVAELRSVLVDPAGEAAERDAASRQLARLAESGVPGADPDTWYGLGRSSGRGPLRQEGIPVVVSPSKVESFSRCALRWVLEQSGGTRTSSSAQSLGNLVHEIAELAPDGDLPRLRSLLDERWPTLGLGTGWPARRDRARAEKMIEKLAEYIATGSRELVAVEQRVQVAVDDAVVRGTVDRLERDAEGRLYVVDLKTGSSQPTKQELEQHAQLGVYQEAIEAGGFDEVAGTRDGARSGGAALVQLGSPTKKVSRQEQKALAEADDPDWARRLIGTVAAGMRGEGFAASGNEMCRHCPVNRSCPLQIEGRQVGT